MPETRCVEQFDTKGNLINKISYEVTDEELAEEKEINVFSKVDTLIDSISSLAEAKTFLKKLCLRLVKNGVIP